MAGVRAQTLTAGKDLHVAAVITFDAKTMTGGTSQLYAWTAHCLRAAGAKPNYCFAVCDLRDVILAFGLTIKQCSQAMIAWHVPTA